MSAQNVMRFKRGDVIFDEETKPEHIYLIQSGRVSLFVAKNGVRIPVSELRSNSIAGIEALFGAKKFSFGCVAEATTEAIQVPVAVSKPQLEAASNFVKLALKSLHDHSKNLLAEVNNLKMEIDPSPMPQGSIPKIFSIINLVSRHGGRKPEPEDLKPPKDDASVVPPTDKEVIWVLPWSTLRIFTMRMFRESPQRMENALRLLQKLKYLDLIMRKTEDEDTGNEVEVLDRVHFFNLGIIEDFAEFYQFHLFKPGKSEMIYVDSIAHQCLKGIAELAKDKEPDRKGAVTISFNALVEYLKKTFKLNFGQTQVMLLEKKGLFLKRGGSSDQPELTFDKKEYLDVCQFWNFITEIDKWNARGTVLLVDPVIEDNTIEGEQCPQCNTKVSEKQNFCPNCGNKMQWAKSA